MEGSTGYSVNTFAYWFVCSWKCVFVHEILSLTLVVCAWNKDEVVLGVWNTGQYA